MARRQLLTEEERRVVFGVPTDRDALARHYTLTRTDLDLVATRQPALVPDETLMDGINAGRKTIPFARFDAKRCAQGLECLRSYRTEWTRRRGRSSSPYCPELSSRFLSRRSRQTGRGTGCRGKGLFFVRQPLSRVRQGLGSRCVLPHR